MSESVSDISNVYSFVSVCLLLKKDVYSFVSMCLLLKKIVYSFLSVCLLLKKKCLQFFVYESTFKIKMPTVFCLCVYFKKISSSFTISI